MKLKTLLFAALLQTVALSAYARTGGSGLFAPHREASIIVNNRILATVNEKSISVIDVMKKMDIIFYRQYPQYSEITEARFQFYQAGWRQVLNDLINKELILCDAIENKLPLSNGDIRQEMEDTFGPNIITNLDRAGITYDEAWEILKGDLLLKRMMYVRVNGRVMKRITPMIVKSYYNEWAKEHSAEPQWRYRMISIRSDNPEVGAEAAKKVYALVTEKGVPVEELTATVKSDGSFPPNIGINVSEEYLHKNKEIAPENQVILGSLSAHQISTPVAQASRRDKTVVNRLFFLTEKIPGGAPPYHEVQAKLKNELIDKESDKETDLYIQKLRRHYNISEQFLKESIPDDFQPFVLQ